ncbi:MAG: preprotein translocase subunit SecE [Patescibacteria group bacterium]
MANKIINYFRESRDELKKAVWPSRKEATKLTLLVIGISLGTAAFLGALDFGLTFVLQKVIK